MDGHASYGGHVPAATGGGVIAEVAPGSPAARVGIVAGDTIISAEDQPLRDVIDWHWLAAGDEVTVSVRSAQGTLRTQLMHRRLDEPWGIAFDEVVFDGVRTCRNRCAFCFMAQLPRGLRRALYLRDDDYRLSFLQGNFVTLTNLRDADVRRIATQRLSPLYVSLHAVDEAVREQLVCARSDRALERFDDLLVEGTDFHVQIVLVPGINDGEVLERTLTWLAQRDGVLSAGIVPLGYTSHQTTFSRSFEDPERSRAVIEQVAPWQEAFRERDGVTWVYLADEFYLNAVVEIPSAEHYDDYPQYENGIGLVRAFLDEFAALRSAIRAAAECLRGHERVTVVTGELFAPVLRAALLESDITDVIGVLAVENRFFGGNVSVSGLLTATDLLAALGKNAEGGVYLLPSSVVNADGVLLDDVPAAELGMRSGRDVRLISCDAGGLLSALRDVAASSPSS